MGSTKTLLCACSQVHSSVSAACDCCVFRFLQRSVDGKHFIGFVVWTKNIWCGFRVKPPFSNSSSLVWTGPHCHFIAFRWWKVQLVKNFLRQELIERNILSPKNNHNGRLFTIVDFKPSTKISMCLHDPFSYRSLPAFNRIRKGRKYLFPRARFFRLKNQTFSSN